MFEESAAEHSKLQRKDMSLSVIAALFFSVISGKLKSQCIHDVNISTAASSMAAGSVRRLKSVDIGIHCPRKRGDKICYT